jgi:hypothetical protein
MAKWQYTAMHMSTGDLGQIVKRLEEQGEAGWELVNVLTTEWSQVGATTFTIWFKRQKPEQYLK